MGNPWRPVTSDADTTDSTRTECHVPKRPDLNAKDSTKRHADKMATLNPGTGRGTLDQNVIVMLKWRRKLSGRNNITCNCAAAQNNTVETLPLNNSN